MPQQLPIRIEPAVHEVISFEYFFETNRRSLYGALCLVTGNRSEAEELMQDAFLRVWERWDKVAGLEDSRRPTCIEPR